MKTGSAILLAAGLWATPAAHAQSFEPEIHRIRVTEGLRFREALRGDVNGDGLLDLVAFQRSYDSPRRRILAVHLRRQEAPAFSSTPDRIVNMPPDACGFALLPIAGNPGLTILAFTPSAVFAMEELEGRSRPRRLCDASFLWQSPDDGDCVPLAAGAVDLDGDGLVDLVIPENGAYRIAMQSRSESGQGVFSTAALLSIPATIDDLRAGTRAGRRMEGRARGRQLAYRAGVDVGGDDPDLLGPLVSIEESVPAAAIIDFNGDGRLDIVSRNGTELIVWLQQPGGVFDPAPSLRNPLPVRTTPERQMDISFSFHAADLTGNRRADAVFVAGQQQSEELRAQVLVYLQGHSDGTQGGTTAQSPLFGSRGMPAQLIPIAGFVGATDLVDVDGDGRLDLSLATFRPDALDPVRSSGKTLDLGWFVFRNLGGSFSPRADLQAEIRLDLKDLDDGLNSLSAQWIADINGDSLRELFVQSASRRFVIYSSRRERGRLTLNREPAWTLETSGSAVPLASIPDPEGRAVVIRTNSELIQLEWHR